MGTRDAREVDQSQVAMRWAAFRVSGAEIERRQLIEYYLDLVKTVVQQLPSSLRRYWSVDELLGFGSLGLIDAIDRHRFHDIESAFEPYAKQRLRGAIYAEMRRLDWLPRTSRHLVADFVSNQDSLRADRAHDPRYDEVLTSMGFDSGQRASAMVTAHQRSRFESLHVGFGAGAVSREDRLVSHDNPEDLVLERFARQELTDAICRLPARQRKVVMSRYVANRTQHEVAVELEVSDTRIASLERRALQGLRQMLATDPAA